ncbi:mechanosensitive ion channel family protein [Sagittula salina]|uniref:Mechanosensitive ion channel n=1 Tax=Sagittula salina TaxID=2820268 RepID=A0A940MNV5_9RHOB|nr:mechanosensitive ion channel domain-containing protein [Sagittula salina]MBP0481988.1 mechanosensitive ion channel [Sagittula salina]
MRGLLNAVPLLLAALWFALHPAGVSAQDTGSGGDAPWFEVDRLNPGLGPVPNGLDRSTPRATVEALLRGTDRLGDPEDRERMLGHLLNLQDIPEAEQAEEGARLARQLLSVLNRRAVIDWGQIIDRPDALDARETSNAATAGMKRRSLLLWEIELDGIPAAIRLERIKAEGKAPVWVFSRQTVQKIPRLYDAFGPSSFEKWLPDALRQDAFWNLMWWEVIGLPLLILLATMTGHLTSKGLGRLGQYPKHRILRHAFRAARAPLIIVAVTLVLSIGTQTLFVFSGRLNTVLTPLIAAGFVTAALMLILNVIEVILDQITGFEDMDLTGRQFDESRTRATRLAAVRRILVIVVTLFGFGIVLASANVFRTYGFSLLASAGVLTLVLGFAARTILSNILSSLQIALNQSARIGDRVVWKDKLCHVERINFTFVQLREWSGVRIVVPVNEFVSTPFENWTLKEPEMLRMLKFKLAPHVDLDRLREAFDAVVAELDSEMLDDPEKAYVRVTGQDVFGMEVWFMLPCADPNTSWDAACIAREALIRRLNDLEKHDNVTIFPHVPAAEAA